MITKEILDHVLALEQAISEFYNSIDNNVNKKLDDQTLQIEDARNQVVELEKQLQTFKTYVVKRFEQFQNSSEESRTQTSKELADVERTLRGMEDRLKEFSEKQQNNHDEITNYRISISRLQTSLTDYERRLQKAEQNVSKRNNAPNLGESSPVGLSNGKGILAYCALALALLLCVGLVICVFYFRSKFVETQARMDDISLDIEDMRRTPIPTPNPTTIPTPIPTLEPAQEPTERPVIGALRESIPELLEWTEVSEQSLELDTEILCAYEKNGVYAIVLAKDSSHPINELDYFREFGLTHSDSVPSLDLDAIDSQGEPSIDLGIEEQGSAASESYTTEAPNTNENDGIENTDSVKQTEKPENIVLKTIWISDQYLCVFYVKQTQASDVDYRQVLMDIQRIYEGKASFGMHDFITAMENHRCYEYIKQAWDKEAGYPISDSFVPEDIKKTIPDDIQTSVWLYCYSRRAFILVCMPTVETDVMMYQNLLETSVEEMAEKYMTRVIPTNNAVILFFYEDEEDFNEDEDHPWYLFENEHDIQD